MQEVEIFVPGRICLFGEHSDWAGQYRRINGQLGKGYTIIASTDHGLYARVKPHPAKLVIRSTLADGSQHGPCEVAMEPEALRAEAAKGGFFSYAAGVALEVLTHYHVKGLEIDNYRTDLPARKGLSSSAAVSVLVARGFNRLYDLKMTVRGEMEFAYRGEIATPSRCGRMDQGCAYGRPILMAFDGDRLDIEELRVGQDLYLLIVDLAAGKDTVRILSDLNHCYPFADNDTARGVQQFLGETGAALVQQAKEALRQGDAARIGQLMLEAQAGFDRLVAPACPSQLTAPVLHRLLSHPGIQPYILGGKGVGSQGDGTAQLVARDAAARETLIQLIEGELGMPCLRLTLKSGQGVRKAVIPAAGFGTRLFPATKSMKKEFFPVVDRDGRVKPAILAIVEEALSAGITDLALVIQQRDREVFEEFFHRPLTLQHFRKLSKENQEYAHHLEELGSHITFIEQPTQDGFGHAVWCAREWVGREPFLLMLGDHLYRSAIGKSCAQQLVETFGRVGRSVVGLMPVPESLVHTVGVVAGGWEEPGRLLQLTEFCEKPAPDYAREHLRLDGVPEGHYLGVFGQYVLEPEIFDLLDRNVRDNFRERGEFQITSCLDRLRQERGFSGYLVQGRRFDLGLPELYYQTFVEFRES